MPLLGQVLREFLCYWFQPLRPWLVAFSGYRCWIINKPEIGCFYLEELKSYVNMRRIHDSCSRISGKEITLTTSFRVGLHLMSNWINFSFLVLYMRNHIQCIYDFCTIKEKRKKLHKSSFYFLKSLGNLSSLCKTDFYYWEKKVAKKLFLDIFILIKKGTQGTLINIQYLSWIVILAFFTFKGNLHF